MESVAEINRLREVYRKYAASGCASSKWSSANKGNQAIRRERDLRTCHLLAGAGFFPLANKRILEVGCGTGGELAKFCEWGAAPENLYGVDLLEDRIRTAQESFPALNFQVTNGESLPFADGSFALVTLYTVFTSILHPQMAQNVANEVTRVLVPGGGILWYDFRTKSPFNQNVRAMRRRTIQALFPGLQVTLESISLLPPLARRLGRLTHLCYAPLACLRVLQTHYLGLFIKFCD